MSEGDSKARLGGSIGSGGRGGGSGAGGGIGGGGGGAGNGSSESNDSRLAVLPVDRSHSWRSVPVIASGDDHGNIRLFNYPCVDSAAAFKQYHAHTSQVTKVRFLNNDDKEDEYMISMGRSEQCFITWKTDCVEENRERIVG